MCNDTNAFDLQFSGTGFSPTIRVTANLDRAQFEADRTTETNSLARIRNTYYQRTKKKRLAIAAVPEYVHDFLSLILGFDHFYIDDTEYNVAPDEEYVINYEDIDDYVGSVSLNVVLKEQLTRNAVTSAEGSGCAGDPPPEGLVDEATGLFTLLSEDGLNILIQENQ